MKSNWLGTFGNNIKQTRFKDIDIAVKLKLFVFLMTVLIIIFVSLIGINNTKKQIIETKKDKLTAILETQEQLIRQYFSNLEKQTILLSATHSTFDAANEFKQSRNDLSINIPYGSISENDITIHLKNYLEGNVLNAINKKQLSDIGLKDIFSDKPDVNYLQYHYISANPNAEDKKSALSKAIEPSDYSNTHLKYHYTFKKFVEEYELNDAYIIDAETGNILYSVNKRVDFGTSLISGPFQRSGLAKVFKVAKESNNKDFIVFSDFEHYIPSKHKTEAFLATPIITDLQKAGVLVISISSDKLSSLVAQTKSTGVDEAYIIGKNNTPRTELFAYQSNVKQFVENMLRVGYSIQEADAIERMNTSKLLTKIQTSQANSSLKGMKGCSISKDYFNNEVLTAYRPLHIFEHNWGLVLNYNTENLFTGVRKIIIVTFLWALVIMALMYFATEFLIKGITNKLLQINLAIKALSKGETVLQNLETDSKDMLGTTAQSVVQLGKRIEEVSTFAQKVGTGDFSYDIQPVSAADTLGISLNEMKSSLEKANAEAEQRAIEDKKRSWSTQGVAKFSDILRRFTNDINELAYMIISNLVEYVDANQGGVFVVQENDQGEHTSTLELAGAYAYERRKYIHKLVELGEGLVGSAAIEKKTIFLKDVPEDYINITSGLGESTPKSILIVPMIVEETVLGIIELASFNIFEEHEIKFVEEIAENVGSTLISTRTNSKTSKLLEESRIRSEEMSAQEEELRQNLEELQATQEEMKRIKQNEEEKELDRRQHEEEVLGELQEKNQQLLMEQERFEQEKILMDAFMNNVRDYIYFKDSECRFLRISKSMVNLFPDEYKTTDDLIGKSDFDFQEQEMAQRFYEDEKAIMTSEKPLIDDVVFEKFDNGHTQWVSTTKMPLYDKDKNVVGIWGITKVITDIKELEIEAKEKAKQLEAQQAYLKTGEAMFNTLMSNIPQQISFKDIDGKYLMLSEALLKALSADIKEDCIGKTDEDLVDKSTYEMNRKTEEQILSGKSDKVEENIVIKDKSGVQSQAKKITVPVITEDNNIIGTLSFTTLLSQAISSGAMNEDDLQQILNKSKEELNKLRNKKR